MSRPVWTGSLGFGHVHVPVRLHGAVSARQVRFHLLHDADGGRIQQKRVCAVDGEEVALEHVVKGYELRPGHHVELTRGELEAFEPQAQHSVELEDFISLSEIDPLLFDTSYHVMPVEDAWRPYATLAQALRTAGRAGVGRLVMHLKGHLCVVWPRGRGLVLSTLHYADELLAPESFPELSAPGPRPLEREVAAMLDTIEARTVAFEPRRYHDAQRERLLAFLERRAHKPAPRALPGAAERGALRLRPLAAREVREPVAGDVSKRPRKSTSRPRKRTSGRRK